MQEKPIRDERIVEAIESCRPGSDDVSDPALAFLAAELAAHPGLDDLYERCQQLDASLAAAFGDVPIPEGLSGRILAGIEASGSRVGAETEELPQQEETEATEKSARGGAEAEERSAVAAPEEGDVEEPLPAEAPRATPRAGRRGPPRWLAGVAVAAGLGAAVLIGVAQFHTTEEVSGDKVLSLAIDFFNAESPGPGEPLTADNEPEDYPFPRRDVRLLAGTSFRAISGFVGFDGVAYDMTNRLGTQATLYVVNCKGSVVTGLPPVPPSFRSAFSTRGCCSAAWQSNGLLYVLVVGGSRQQTYDSFLPVPGPVT